MNGTGVQGGVPNLHVGVTSSWILFSYVLCNFKFQKKSEIRVYYFNGTKCFRRFLDRDVHSGRSLSGEGEDLCIGGAAMAGGSRHGQQKCNGMIVRGK